MKNLLVVLLLPICTFAADKPSQQWAQWRGPLGTGVAPDAKPPLEWSEKKNVRWKIKIPGRGHSSPVVWNNHVFLTTAIPIGEKFKPRYSGAPGAHDNLPITRKQQFVVLAVNRENGKILWQRAVYEAIPHEGGHYTGSLASASPVTDGKHVFAFFGSFGLYCLDFEGKLIWKKQLGKLNTKHGHGEGSSPALHGDTLIVNQDHEGKSFIVALDKKTGKELWKAKREEVTSWSTPIVVTHKGKAQAIVPGTKRMRGYDLATGKVLWQVGGLSGNIVASPVHAKGVVYAGSSYEIRSLLAVRLEDAKGDLTGTKNVLWKRTNMTPYVPSPLLYGESIYYLRHYQNVLSRVDAKTGMDEGGPFRLGGLGNIYASPVGAADRVYVTDQRGVTLVLEHGGKEPKVLAVNRVGDNVSASLALVGEELFLRGETNLYCIAEAR